MQITRDEAEMRRVDAELRHLYWVIHRAVEAAGLHQQWSCYMEDGCVVVGRK